MAADNKSKTVRRTKAGEREKIWLEGHIDALGLTRAQFLGSVEWNDRYWTRLFHRKEWDAQDVAKIANGLRIPADVLLSRIGFRVAPRPCKIVGTVSAEGHVRTGAPRNVSALYPTDAPDDTVAVLSTAGPWRAWLWYFEPTDSLQPAAISRLAHCETPDGRVIGTISPASMRGRHELALIGGEVLKDVKVLSASPIIWMCARY